MKQTFRASEIVNNLLNFSRTGAAESAEVDLNSVLEETLTLVQHPFKTARVKVIRNYAQKLAAGAGLDNAPAAGVSESVHERARCHAGRRNAGGAHGGV